LRGRESATFRLGKQAGQKLCAFETTEISPILQSFNSALKNGILCILLLFDLSTSTVPKEEKTPAEEAEKEWERQAGREVTVKTRFERRETQATLDEM
jgi:hypothetical protein